MPPVEVYKVNFKNGNLNPFTTTNWGPLQPGGQGPSDAFRRFGDSKGIHLQAIRAPGSSGPVSHSLYVIPGEVALPLATRLAMSVWFDWPEGVAATPETKAEAWAVVLRLKQRGSTVDDNGIEPMINVTCQFNNNTNGRNGVRLNTPDAEQDLPADKPTDLVSPLDYKKFRPGCLGLGNAVPFVLDFAFCGVQAGPRPDASHDVGEDLGHAVGRGALSIGEKKDQRVFSSTSLSTGQPWIGAMGISIVTLTGVGTLKVRLRQFSISVWQ